MLIINIALLIYGFAVHVEMLHELYTTLARLAVVLSFSAIQQN